MTGPTATPELRILAGDGGDAARRATSTATTEAETSPSDDAGLLIRTCANCGAEMDERKCKLICRCGYFLSCSDYY